MSASSSPIRVLVVDDSALVREGLRAVLASHGGAIPIQVVGEAASASEGVLAARELKPSVVLLDIRLPDGSGLKACEEICRAQPAPQVLILTSVATDELIRDAIAAGAQGYLMKEIDPGLLVRSIADAAEGKAVLTPEITARVRRLLRDPGLEGETGLGILSPQERRVLALIAEGRTNKEIGFALELSEKTVKNYLSRVFEKLDVSRRAQAAVVYTQLVRKEEGPIGPGR